MNIIGINAFHGDSAACLVQGGRLIAAAEEERFRRIKHWAGFPAEAIRFCLASAGLRLSDVDHIAVNHDPRAHWGQKALYALRRLPSPDLVLDRLRNRARRAEIPALLQREFPDERFRGAFHHVEHHLAHLASTFFVSPFDEAVVVSVDGFGDFSSAAWGFGQGTRITIDGRVHFPHSLGVFYQAMTQYLGFPHYGDEYKVMGLAPYGEPRYLEKMREVVRLQDDGGFRLDLRYFRHHAEKIDYAWEGGSPHVGQLYSAALEELLGPARHPDEPLSQRHKDIARSTQAMYEEAFFHMLNAVHRHCETDALALAGGCAMNSVANGKVYRHTPFRRVYVQSAAGDAGGAIGAAMAVWHSVCGGQRGFVMEHAYWGPEFADEALGKVLERHAAEVDAAGCQVRRIGDEGELCRLAAQAIASGRVVGWFQGRMEWGPRALGNRSILGDPRRADMKDILNLKIKRRESFRPFAPSILREAVTEWFETEDDVPFMMQVFQIRQEKRVLIPAVTHVDGSGRLQTVHRHTNPRYYRLIETFRDLTGIPILLNTSFNENEPVVCRPEEALDCFLRTRMDVLVMGNWMLTRHGETEGPAS
ncbi:MAG: carbamoyltransferase [Rhodocyclaceae bacterium]|jgi:carbamoyltransferase|nr:carbamoyltransferase [Rhodocyclaceae bacterium]